MGDTKERYGTTPKYCFLSDGGCDPPVVHSREEKGGGEDPACFTLTRHKSQAVACQVRLPNCARMACAFFASGDALSCRGGMRARDRFSCAAAHASAGSSRNTSSESMTFSFLTVALMMER